VDLHCRLVDVRLGVDDASLQSRDAIAIEDDETSVRVHITQLNHKRLDALVQKASEDRLEEEESLVEEGNATPSVVEPVPAETTPEPIEQEARLISPGETDEENELQREATEAHSERVRAFLGTAPGAYGKTRDVWFDPASPELQLPNPHILVTGETGSGKTQATKAILANLRQHRIPALILDFKDDYSDQTYTEIEGLQVYDPSYESLPFIPLAPLGDPGTGRVNPSYHVHQLADIVKRIYRLGDQQAYRFREAIKRAYEAASIPLRAFEPSPEQTYPPFEVVRAQLDADKGNEALLGRLSPIFDLELFSSGVETGFAKAATTSTVVRLGQLPDDETKNSVAEFFLMALYNYLIRQVQTHALGRLLVRDEAWHLIESPFLVPLIREGRAFGLGVLVATQFPGDLPEGISGSTATKLFFSQTQLSQIREIQRTVVGKTSGSNADHLAGVLRGLAPLTCVLHSKQHTPFVRVKIKPYIERREASSQA
jgi:Helicase HerA, central domain